MAEKKRLAQIKADQDKEKLEESISARLELEQKENERIESERREQTEKQQREEATKIEEQKKRD